MDACGDQLLLLWSYWRLLLIILNTKQFVLTGTCHQPLIILRDKQTRNYSVLQFCFLEEKPFLVWKDEELSRNWDLFHIHEPSGSFPAPNSDVQPLLSKANSSSRALWILNRHKKSFVICAVLTDTHWIYCDNFLYIEKNQIRTWSQISTSINTECSALGNMWLDTGFVVTFCFAVFVTRTARDNEVLFTAGA